MTNFTCNMLGKHSDLWLSIESFVPAYPTSIRGANDQRGPGDR
jgi:hypothetical protein